MSEKDLRGEASEPTPKQSQIREQLGGKDAQSTSPQEQTIKAKDSSQKPVFQVQGRAPTSEQLEQIKASAEYWNRVRDEEVVKAMDRSQDTAKQLIGLMGALQALYIATYAFTDFRQQLGAFHFLSSYFCFFFISCLF